MKGKNLIKSSRGELIHCVNMSQRRRINFGPKVGKIETKTYDTSREAYGEDVASRAQTFRWFERFENDRGNIEDDARSDRPNTTSNAKLAKAVADLLKNGSVSTLRIMASELNVKKECIRLIITGDKKQTSECLQRSFAISR